MMQSTINLSRCSLLGLSECSLLNLLGGIPLGGPGTASILVLGDDITVAPSELGGELTEVGELAAWLQASDAEGIWDDDLLDLVEWLWDTLNSLDALECSGSTVPDVRQHTANNTHEHVSRGLVVEWTLPWVGVHTLVALHEELELVADVGARNDEPFAAHNNDLLSHECFLGDERGKATEKVPACIDHSCFLKHGTTCAARPVRSSRTASARHAPAPRASAARAAFSG